MLHNCCALAAAIGAQALAIAFGIVYADPASEINHLPRQPATGLLGNSSMVEQRTLTPSILVRIQVPQPNLFLI